METGGIKTVDVVVNGVTTTVPDGSSVVELLKHLEIDPARVAVEMNREIVRKQDWGSVRVPAGAVLEVVWFVGGG